MKKCAIFLFFLIPGLCCADSIPNAGFESWWFGGWGANPAQWTVNNSPLLAANIVPDSDSHSGLLAMQMINSGNFRPYASCGFSITSHPTAFSGFMKSHLMFADTATMSVRLFSGGIPVDSGFGMIVGGTIIMGYFPFNVAISTHATVVDSCEIVLLGGNIFQSQVTYDDLSLTIGTGIEETVLPSPKIWPNPASNRVQVDLPAGAYQLQLTDGSGKLVRSMKTEGRKSFVDVASLQAGEYILTVFCKTGTAAATLVKD